MHLNPLDKHTGFVAVSCGTDVNQVGFTNMGAWNKSAVVLSDFL